ncbi:MAG TPA: DUF922 domain-containing protein, partial [Dehalococcoidia bacterium]
AYIQANAPLDDSGARAAGLTSYTPSLDWDSNHDPRACAIARMTIGIDLTVTLPSLANLAQLPAALQANWNNYAAGVAAHEQHHVDIWLQGAETLRQKMAAIAPTAGCAALDTKVQEIWQSEYDATNKLQEQFHKDEAARLDALRAPLKSQIDANKATLANLTSQIGSLDASIAALSNQIDPLKKLLDSLQSQIDAIETKYKDSTPPADVFDQHQRLVSQYNNLIPSYNTLISQYNQQAAQRKALTQQADTLSQQTNDLIEQYNWVR